MRSVTFYSITLNFQPSRANCCYFELCSKRSYFQRFGFGICTLTDVYICLGISCCSLSKFCLLCILKCFLCFSIFICVADVKDLILVIEYRIFPVIWCYILKSMLFSIFHSDHKILSFFFCSFFRRTVLGCIFRIFFFVSFCFLKLC